MTWPVIQVLVGAALLWVAFGPLGLVAMAVIAIVAVAHELRTD